MRSQSAQHRYRGGLELLADDLIDPTMVARNLESMRRAKQWMKVRDCTLE
jgi:hypothetical protein